MGLEVHRYIHICGKHSRLRERNERIVRDLGDGGRFVAAPLAARARERGISEAEAEASFAADFPIRRRFSLSIPIFPLRCTSGERWSHWQPPQSPKSGQGGSTLPGPAVTSLSRRPRHQERWEGSMETRARSPGAVMGTKTTLPSCRPTPSPPQASRSMAISVVSSGMFLRGELSVMASLPCKKVCIL